jgi:glutamate-1-semialdehyde aminotransferase
MDVIAQQKVFHAGTYATNPLVMAAGLATLREVLTPAGYAHIGKVSDALVSGYKQIVQKTGLEAYVESAGPMAPCCSIPTRFVTIAIGLRSIRICGGSTGSVC